FDGDDVGGEPLGGELEGGACAGARLVEEVDDRPAAQGRDLLDVPLADLGEALRAVEDALDLGSGESLDSQQVLHDSTSTLAAAGAIATSSRPSFSSRRTFTRSPGAVGRFLPT